MKSIQIANKWFDETEKYKTMKVLEHEKKSIQNELKNRMGEERRFVDKESKVVLKFMSYPTYKIDNAGLNSFLNDYGVLVHTVKFDEKNLSDEVLNKIKDFKLEDEFYVKLTTKRMKKEEFNFSNLTVAQLVYRWKRVKEDYDILDKEYEIDREEMNTCNYLITNNGAKFDYGTITRVKKSTAYDIHGIYQEFGEDFVIENASPVLSKIEEFMYQGYFLSSEVEKFKQLYDLNSRFVVMTLEEESKIMNYLGNRKVQGSLEWEQMRKSSI